MLSAVVVTLESSNYLRACLESLCSQTVGGLEIIVIFNNSQDKGISSFRKDFPRLQFIINEKNMFLGKAYNIGIEQSKGDFVMCLNDDVALSDNYIEELLKVAVLDESIGMVSGKVLRMDKKTIDSTGLFLGKNRTAVERGYNKVDSGQYDKEGYVFGVSGAVGFYKRRMLLDIKDKYGFFDERFNMFYEDLDLCWRANKQGWKAFYAPKALAYHKRGGTAQSEKSGPAFFKEYSFAKLNDELKSMLIRNRFLTILKNDSLAGFLLNFIYILSYDLKIFLYILLFSPGALFLLTKRRRRF
jgi:hypothetical protein